MGAPRAGHSGTINQSSAFKIDQSLRFNSSDTAHFDRTPSSVGNRQTWTYSVWVKGSDFSGDANTVLSGGNYQYGTYLWFRDGGHVAFGRYYSGGYTFLVEAEGFYRDPTAWYHLVFAYDTTQATASNRVKLYVNGEQITSFTTESYPSLNFETDINNDGIQWIGERGYDSSLKLHGYLAEVHLVDGSALDPSYFGFTDPLTNTWRPKKYDGTYGTNGFYLDFSDSSNLGADKSGNGNNWTPNNFEVYDVVPDSPSGVTFSTTSPGITTSQPSNYCALNPLDEGEFGGGLTLSDGNLKCVSTASDRHVRSTFFMPTSGKYYFEMIATVVNTAGYLATGLYHSTGSLTSTAIATAQGRWYAADGTGNGSSWGNTYDDRDLIGIAVDMDAGKIWASKNGVFQASGNPVTGANPMYSDLLTAYSSDGWSPVCANWQTANTAEFNFGQFPMSYSPGTSSATEYFNAVNYTGNSSTQSVTGVGFQPDFVWIKSRSETYSHNLFDVARGATKYLESDDTATEATVSSTLTSFDSDGFSLGSAPSSNNSGGNYTAFCWKAGGAASALNTGSINANVSANQDAGFSVVTYTGTGTAGTVAHGLADAPSLILLKNRDSAEGWRVYLSTLSSASKYLVLNTNAAEDTANSVWNGTAPTSSVFSIGDGTAVNNSGDNFVAYCWAEKTGVNKIGTYVGDGNAVGPAVDVGFKPAMVIIKKTNAASEWAIYDRTTTNAINGSQLRADASDTENTNIAAKVILTNYGFKILTSDNAQNGDGVTYSYIAFAENFVPDERYKELCTANIPTPTSPAAVRPDKYVGIVTYTGNNLQQPITGLGFQPDWVWIKCRNQSSTNHILQDSVRGAQKYFTSDTTVAEGTSDGTIISFDSDGFTIGAGNPSVPVNNDGDDFVAWCWKAGGPQVTNTDGTITSYVSVSSESGVGIVTYTGTGTAGNGFGHGLGVAPKMVLIKGRSNSDNWHVYHESTGNTGGMFLNLTNTFTTSEFFWDDTSPSSTVVTLSSGASNNSSGVTYAAYCFSEVIGFSKISSYVGNGNANGPFVHCGFRPAWLMVKNKDTAQGWYIVDDERDSYNPTLTSLVASSSDAESNSSTGANFDFLSNGFKLRSSNDDSNKSGDTYIFAAFAAAPTNNLYGGQSNAR